MRILGISAFYHDSAAALVIDGKIVAAAQEERFTRKKHDASMPLQAIKSCLSYGKINANEIDIVTFYEKPFIKFERLLETYAAFAPKGLKSFRSSLPIWIKDKLFQKNKLIKNLEALDADVNWAEKLTFSEHHLSHAASAFFPSPFAEAAILTMDGVGEWSTTSCAQGSKNNISIQKEIHFPHSLGLLYSAFTTYAGFRVNSGEYKLMGLAPYGQPHYAQKILDNLIDVKTDGSFRLNQDYFDYSTGLRMTNDKFAKLFGGKPRLQESSIRQRDMDIAASIQSVTEEIILKLITGLKQNSPSNNLCLAGGVALNCVANGKIAKLNIFEKLWIQPAAGDAGGAIGAALVAYHMFKNKNRHVSSSTDSMSGALLGPEFSQNEIKEFLIELGANFEYQKTEDLITTTAESLANGDAVGWFQGRMEFGPRALGARSILGNPSLPDTQKQLNLKVKFRESFRPFAPAILKDQLANWFDLEGDNKYMLIVANIKDDKRTALSQIDQEREGTDKVNAIRSLVPAVTHVDYSARIQSVDQETNPLFHALIKKFEKITGIPMLINTSFNIRSEPIVCNPRDAFKCFMATDLDMLVIGNYILHKSKQDSGLQEDYLDQFTLD